MSFFERFQEWRNPTISKLDMDGVIKKSMKLWENQFNSVQKKKEEFLQSWQALEKEIKITSKLDASIATRVGRLGEIIQYCANFPKALEISRIAERGFNGAEPDAQNLLAYLTFGIFPRMDPGQIESYEDPITDNFAIPRIVILRERFQLSSKENKKKISLQDAFTVCLNSNLLDVIPSGNLLQQGDIFP